MNTWKEQLTNFFIEISEKLGVDALEFFAVLMIPFKSRSVALLRNAMWKLLLPEIFPVFIDLICLLLIQGEGRFNNF